MPQALQTIAVQMLSVLIQLDLIPAHVKMASSVMDTHVMTLMSAILEHTTAV